jgi:hypothetical protein
MREGRSITPEEMTDDDDIIQTIRSITISKNIAVQSGPEPEIGNAPVVDYEEGTLPGSRWTHRRLQKLPCWDRWKRAETTQLESMEKYGVYGPPCIAPRGAIVLRTVWTYYVKWDGTLKSRSCCNGSERSRHRLFPALYIMHFATWHAYILVYYSHSWMGGRGRRYNQRIFPSGPFKGTPIRAHG